MSMYGIAAPGLTVNADKYDSLIDEKMIKLVHELVTVGIAQTEVGKAAKVCYLDLIKAKVLFALPGHMTKSYACRCHSKFKKNKDDVDIEDDDDEDDSNDHDVDDSWNDVHS
ncbi:hypothetical protein Tco_1099138 [Tanacetum coccineum]